jgi:transposase
VEGPAAGLTLRLSPHRDGEGRNDVFAWTGLAPKRRTPKIRATSPGGVHMTGKRKRREFTAEYKAEVVALFRTTDKSVAQLAKELDLTPSAVQRWVTQAEVDAGNREGLTTTEREELAYLRRENRVLREERDILKRATAFFAKEIR